MGFEVEVEGFHADEEYSVGLVEEYPDSWKSVQLPKQSEVNKFLS